MPATAPTVLVLLSGARPAMAEYLGIPGYALFKDVSASALGAHATRAVLARANAPAARGLRAARRHARRLEAQEVGETPTGSIPGRM